MNQTKRKRGRPKGAVSNNPATERLPHIRVTPEQISSYKSEAEKRNSSLSAWVKQVLDKAVSAKESKTKSGGKYNRP